jgi:hypothetical protein
MLTVIHSSEYLENVRFIKPVWDSILGLHEFKRDLLTVHCEKVLYRPAAIVVGTQAILFAQYFSVAVELAG